jgi:hypothetical protein
MRLEARSLPSTPPPASQLLVDEQLSVLSDGELILVLASWAERARDGNPVARRLLVQGERFLARQVA